MVLFCEPSSGRSRVQDQPRIHGKTPHLKKKNAGPGRQLSKQKHPLWSLRTWFWSAGLTDGRKELTLQSCPLTSTWGCSILPSPRGNSEAWLWEWQHWPRIALCGQSSRYSHHCLVLIYIPWPSILSEFPHKNHNDSQTGWIATDSKTLCWNFPVLRLLRDKGKAYDKEKAWER